MSEPLSPAQVEEIRADLTPTIDELCPFHDLGREGAVCDCPPGHPNHIQPGTRPATPADARVKEISVRYEGFGQPDPPCTCTRTDVDFYDTSGCERCDRKSDYNRADSHAKYMLDLYGAQDIYFLRDSYDAQARRIADTKAQAETLHRIIRQICESIGCESPDEHGNGCAPLLAALVEIERLKADASTVAHREDVRDRVDELAYATARDRIIALSDEVVRLKAARDGWEHLYKCPFDSCRDCVAAEKAIDAAIQSEQAKEQG